MRSKEDAMDYRYFPDPDLLPLIISQEWIDAVRSIMGSTAGGTLDVPAGMAALLVSKYGLSLADARALTADRMICDYFREVLAFGPKVSTAPADVRLCANFVIGEFNKKRNESNLPANQVAVHPETVGRLLQRVFDGTISLKTAKELFAEFWDLGAKTGSSYSADGIDDEIQKRGLIQISDSGAIEKIVDEVLANNQKSVDEFKSGKEKAFQALVGQVMKATQGKANPAQVNEILKQKLGA
jgi:aspartyl-tRNA(Asn)/glutamyl-tRNA(Gln) amidotransferase subunit B